MTHSLLIVVKLLQYAISNCSAMPFQKAYDSQLHCTWYTWETIRIKIWLLNVINMSLEIDITDKLISAIKENQQDMEPKLAKSYFTYFSLSKSYSAFVEIFITCRLSSLKTGLNLAHHCTSVQTLQCTMYSLPLIEVLMCNTF